MGVSSTGTLQNFVLRQRDHWFTRILQPEEATELLAKTLVEELTKTTPGPGKHPLATGNLLSALTTVSPLHVDGRVYWIGVGDMSRLGRPGEKSYAPEPIKRFLQSRREEQARVQAERRETRTAERARIETARAERERTRDVTERAEYYRTQTNMARRSIGKLQRELAMIQDRYDRLQSTKLNYDTRISRWESSIMIDISKPSYQKAIARRNELAKRLRALQQREQALENSIARREEALMRFQQHWNR